MGKFLTDMRYWEPVSLQAPNRRVSRNRQIAIRAKVMGNEPGRPEFVAVHRGRPHSNWQDIGKQAEVLNAAAAPDQNCLERPDHNTAVYTEDP